jgi:hypothetical protein
LAFPFVFPSAQAIGERGFDLGGSVQRAEHGDRFDSRPRQIGRDVVGDDSKAEDADVEPFPRRLNGLEVLAGEVLNPSSSVRREAASFAISACLVS